MHVILKITFTILFKQAIPTITLTICIPMATPHVFPTTPPPTSNPTILFPTSPPPSCPKSKRERIMASKLQLLRPKSFSKRIIVSKFNMRNLRIKKLNENKKLPSQKAKKLKNNYIVQD